jgi:CBS domain-containing protein
MLLQVGDAMVGREKVISVRPSMAMSEAAHLMLHHDVSLIVNAVDRQLTIS